MTSMLKHILFYKGELKEKKDANKWGKKSKKEVNNAKKRGKKGKLHSEILAS